MNCIVCQFKAITHSDILIWLVSFGHCEYATEAHDSLERSSLWREDHLLCDTAILALDVLKPSPWDVVPHFNFALVAKWLDHDQLFDVVHAAQLSPNIGVDQVAEVISFVDEWLEILLFVGYCVLPRNVILNIPVEYSLHLAIVL